MPPSVRYDFAGFAPTSRSYRTVFMRFRVFWQKICVSTSSRSSDLAQILSTDRDCARFLQYSMALCAFLLIFFEFWIKFLESLAFLIFWRAKIRFFESVRLHNFNYLLSVILTVPSICFLKARQKMHVIFKIEQFLLFIYCSQFVRIVGKGKACVFQYSVHLGGQKP